MCINKRLLVYSNIVFIISFIYLLFNNKKIESILLLLIGIISSLYHTYESNHLYAVDVLFGLLIFLYTCYYYKDCIYFLPLILLSIYYIITYASYYYDETIYAYMHSIWHILACVYIIYLFTRK
jgi:hypothetical protein